MAKVTPVNQKSALGTVNFLQSIRNIQTNLYIGISLLHFCEISVSSVFLVTIQYVSHHKKFNVLVYVEGPVTGHDVFGGKLH